MKLITFLFSAMVISLHSNSNAPTRSVKEHNMRMYVLNEHKGLLLRKMNLIHELYKKYASDKPLIYDFYSAKPDKHISIYNQNFTVAEQLQKQIDFLEKCVGKQTLLIPHSLKRHTSTV